jgi:hypothetical protein
LALSKCALQARKAVMACKLCQHPQHEAFDQELRSGGRIALRTIAERYKIHWLPLSTHQRRCLKVGTTTSSKLPMSAPYVEPGVDVLASIEHHELTKVVEAEECTCEWCSLSMYNRLKRAWSEVTELERQKFCIDTRNVDWPF